VFASVVVRMLEYFGLLKMNVGIEEEGSPNGDISTASICKLWNNVLVSLSFSFRTTQLSLFFLFLFD